MRAGKLDRIITIERPTSTVDDFGAVTEIWETITGVRAQLIEASTEEFMRGFGASSESVTVFRVRYMGGVTLADRVIYDGRAFDLKEVKELGRRAGLELRCTASGVT